MRETPQALRGRERNRKIKSHFKRTIDAPASKTDGECYTYIDCLRGTAPVPLTPNGKTLLQVLIAGGMVTFMITINGIRTTDLEFLANLRQNVSALTQIFGFRATKTALGRQ